MKAGTGTHWKDNRDPRALCAALAGLLMVVPIVGCGGSSETTASRPATQAPAVTTSASSTAASQAASQPTHTTATPAATPETHAARSHPLTSGTLEVSSPGSDPYGGELQSRYTCDGQNIPLPLKLYGVPSGTKELMIAVIKVEPVNGQLYFPWAVMHVAPTTREIVDGKLPPGAVVGTNGNGETSYNFCPPKGKREAYVATVYALRHSLPAKTGFDPRLMRLEVKRHASYVKQAIFTYTRR